MRKTHTASGSSHETDNGHPRSPGRGKYGNMGSKPVGHPDARLVHHALGSWRHFDVWVEYGKFCRTVFGLCRDWSKVPSS